MTSRKSEYRLASFPGSCTWVVERKKKGLINTLGGMLTLPMMPATDHAVLMTTEGARIYLSIYLTYLSYHPIKSLNM